MTWITKSDIFDNHCHENLSQLEGKALKLTKSGISSIILHIHDRTGLLSPFILKQKLILQSTLVLKDKNDKSLGWDDHCTAQYKNRKTQNAFSCLSEQLSIRLTGFGNLWSVFFVHEFIISATAEVQKLRNTMREKQIEQLDGNNYKMLRRTTFIEVIITNIQSLINRNFIDNASYTPLQVIKKITICEN